MPAARVSTSTDRERDYVRALHKTFGTIRVNHARNEPTWDLLLLALRRADDLGHDPADILTAPSVRRTLRTTTSITQPLALAVHRHLDTRNTDALTDPSTAWRHIVHALTRLEHAGTDPATALTVAHTAITTGPNPATLPALAAQFHLAASHLEEPHLPAWLRTVHRVDNPEWRPYLDARAELIRHRIDALAVTTATTRPAWTTSLGTEPTDPIERETWLRHLATLAAYRDQYQVTDNDPDHPLGPYPERGKPGHRAYWIAAASLLALHGTGTAADPSHARLATDRYRTLPAEQQASIAAELAERLGPNWLGDTQDAAADADQPVYQDQLAAILVEHGHLDGPASERVTAQESRSPGATARAKQRPDRQNRVPRPRSQPTPEARRAAEPRNQPNAPIQRPPRTSPNQPRGPRPGQ